MGRRIARLWGIAVAVTMPVVLIAGGAGAIIGGDDDGDGHPNVGFVIVLDGGGNFADACTGTLVAPRVVLTAAHCLPDRYQFAVSFKSNVVRGGGVDNGLLYVNGVARNDEYDVGVLRLVEPATTVYPEIRPADLPHEGALEEYHRGDWFTHVGYGLDHVPTRRQSSPNAVTTYTRRTLNAPLSKLTGTLLFTRSRDGNLCKGDSGGPVFDEDLGVLVALGNSVSGNCNGSNSGPRLDIEPVRSFLSENGVRLP